jgi:hypothetical protein
MTTYWSFNADTNRCTIYNRDEHNTPVFETFKFNFEQALHLAQAFDKLYQQGLEHGREEISRAVRGAPQHGAGPK